MEEFRQITVNHNVRILCYSVPGTRKYMMLHACVKKGQNTKQKDINAARNYKVKHEEQLRKIEEKEKRERKEIDEQR